MKLHLEIGPDIRATNLFAVHENGDREPIGLVQAVHVHALARTRLLSLTVIFPAPTGHLETDAKIDAAIALFERAAPPGAKVLREPAQATETGTAP